MYTVHARAQYSINLKKIIQFTSLDVHGFPGFMGITHMCKQYTRLFFKRPGSEVSYDHFMIEEFMTWGLTSQDCFALAGQQFYHMIAEFIPKLKSRQAGVGGRANSRGATATGKKKW